MENKFWSENYKVAKNKFNQAIKHLKAKNINVLHEQLSIDELDPNDESLKIDITWIGDSNAEKIYISPFDLKGNSSSDCWNFNTGSNGTTTTGGQIEYCNGTDAYIGFHIPIGYKMTSYTFYFGNYLYEILFVKMIIWEFFIWGCFDCEILPLENLHFGNSATKKCMVGF